MTHLSELIQERQKVPFAGLTSNESVEIPDAFLESMPFGEPTQSFKDIIGLLPNASRGRLKSVNDYVNEDGSIDTGRVTEAIDGDSSFDFSVADLPVEPESIESADRLNPVRDYIEIVDDRRKALDALGYNCHYRWQIAPDSSRGYSTNDPQDNYRHTQRVLRENGEADSIFGWCDLRDYGGHVDIYLFFTSQTLTPALNVMNSQHCSNNTSVDPVDISEQTDRDPLILGLRTGYNFRGTRSFDFRIIAFDSETKTLLRNFGERRSRTHRGDPDRDIRKFIDQQYARLQSYCSDSLEATLRASLRTLDFSQLGYSLEEFYSYFEIPDVYCEEAAKYGRQLSSNPKAISMWHIAIALWNALEDNFSGEHKTSTTFMGYALIGKRFLFSPDKQIAIAQREHELAQSEGEDESQLQVDPQQNTLLEDVEKINGVSTDDDLTIIERDHMVSMKQQTLPGL